MTARDLLYQPSKRRNQVFIFLLVLFVVNASAQNSASSEGLIQQITALQNQMKVQIIGLEKIQNEEKVFVNGNWEQQFQQMLVNFNHVISRNAKGQIERIVIMNKKQKSEEPRIVLPTHAEGHHLLVSVAISGDGQRWRNMDMLIDTGADLVVLPESMINELGLAEGAFTEEKIQTANGLVAAKVGVLRAVTLAGETVENAQAAFIADQLLGKNGLLGMSVLGRYRITIDDNTQSISLFRK